ncbi:hypothetical protein KYLE_64 [Pantoea phage Kyle]|uniref:Uncharacterized protein n=1 Tax=Pantoea phage Kyle TaxID=2589665 RepID=A0A514A8S2_9CAUD|nr:hypothetical protein HWC52_gp064 [Pantoea phage Kyle]QDH49673.1 hypothetical protein KYLE_64 [Pantoea phage Kyle]
MTAKKENTEVAEVAKNEIALGSFVNMDDFGQGFEGADQESYALPFIAVLQKMSPMVDEDSPKYVAGAKSGMLINTVTQQLYDGKAGIVIVPAAYKRSFVRWGSRDADGGFKGEVTVEEFKALVDSGAVLEIDGKHYAVDENGKVDPKKADYYADTRSHFVIAIDPETGEFGQALLSLAATATKASRALMTALSQKKVQTSKGLRTPPTFLNMVRLTTQGQSNDKGNWSVPSFKLEGLVDNADIYSAAKELHDAVAGGTVVVDRSKEAGSASDQPVEDTPQDAEGF